MGLHVTGRLLPNEATAQQWASAYAEVLTLVDAYDFLDIVSDRERFAKYGAVWHYGVKTRERECNNKTGLFICGALSGCVTAESQALFRQFEHYSEGIGSPQGEVCRDALCTILKNRRCFAELDRYHDASKTIFGNKTQGFAHHNYLLAICLLLEDRLGHAFVTDGDITRGQIKAAIAWANQHLQRPVSLPDRMNNEALLSRLRSFIPPDILLSAFLQLSFNPKDEEMGAFLRANFTVADIFAYWQREADNTKPGTFGAQEFFLDYFAMSDDLSLLTKVCLHNYTPEQYAKQLANSRIFEETKETKDPLKLTAASSNRETPESISVVMGKVFGMGMRNSAVARYISIEKGIADIAPILPGANELIAKAMEECKPRNASVEETIKKLDEASESLAEGIQSVDVYEPEALVFYERGFRLRDNMWLTLKKIREFVDEHKTKVRADFDTHFGKHDIRDTISARMAVLVHCGRHLLPKTAWDYFESRIADDGFFDAILGLHSLQSDTVPLCYYVKGILCNRELFEDVMLS